MSAPGAEETGEAPANHPPSAGHELPAVAVVAPLVAALALWLAALPGIEPDQMTELCDHSRQPECSATMPPLITRNETRWNPAARIIPAKGSGFGKVRIDSTR